MMRVAVGNDFDIAATFYNGEVPTNPDATPTLTVRDSEGNTVITGLVTADGSGVYHAKVAAFAEVDLLTTQWDAVMSGYAMRQTDTVAVDGAYLFRLAELRENDAVSDSDRFPSNMLEAARSEVTTFINDYTRTAFVETFHAETQDGKSSNVFLTTRVPPLRVLGAEVNGVVQDVSGYTVAQDGRIRSATAWTSSLTEGQGVVVRYVYARPGGVPADLKRAALQLATQWLRRVDSQIPDRARQMITQWGTYQLATSSEEYPTGYPEIDSVLQRYSWRVPFIG